MARVDVASTWWRDVFFRLPNDFITRDVSSIGTWNLHPHSLVALLLFSHSLVWIHQLHGLFSWVVVTRFWSHYEMTVPVGDQCVCLNIFWLQIFFLISWETVSNILIQGMCLYRFYCTRNFLKCLCCVFTVISLIMV